MAKSEIIFAINSGEDNGALDFSLTKEDMDLATTLRAIISSKLKSMPQGFNSEYTGYRPDNDKIIELVDNVCKDFLKAYPEDHPKHGEASEFVTKVQEEIQKRFDGKN